MIIINDINDVAIDQFRNLKVKTQSQVSQNTFIVEGKKAVLKLLNSNFRVDSILAVREFHDEFFSIIKDKVPPSKQFVASKQLMNELIGFKLHTGIMAEAVVPIEKIIHEKAQTIVALNKITDAENIGSIIRNCLAFGIDNLILDSGCCNPYSRRVARVSMGSVFYVNIQIVKDLSEILKELKNYDFRIIASENNTLSKSYKNIEPINKKILIFGNETAGITNDILGLCDEVIHIPMTNKIESLNVASASAILLGHFFDLSYGITK